MKNLTIILILILIIVTGITIFLKLGRATYIPVVTKLKGKQTVESRISQIEKRAMKRLQPNLQQLEMEGLPHDILLVGLKEERILQIYCKINKTYQLLKTFPFTAFSGQLGPKLKEGDLQIPEGIYKIAYLNPNSSYYLSLKVSYPNEFDKQNSKLKTVAELGGDIFIHGKSATIGCIPIGDEAIEELFLLANKAYANEIKVVISPRDFRINPNEPKVAGIDWEKQLYAEIKHELNQLPSKLGTMK